MKGSNANKGCGLASCQFFKNLVNLSTLAYICLVFDNLHNLISILVLSTTLRTLSWMVFTITQPGLTLTRLLFIFSPPTSHCFPATLWYPLLLAHQLLALVVGLTVGAFSFLSLCGWTDANQVFTVVPQRWAFERMSSIVCRTLNMKLVKRQLVGNLFFSPV